MDKLQELEKNVSKLRSLSQVVERKIADAKRKDENVDSQSQDEFLQLQLRSLRQRTLLRTLQQLQSQLLSQRQRLDILKHKTADRRR